MTDEAFKVENIYTGTISRDFIIGFTNAMNEIMAHIREETTLTQQTILDANLLVKKIDKTADKISELAKNIVAYNEIKQN